MRAPRSLALIFERIFPSQVSGAVAALAACDVPVATLTTTAATKAACLAALEGAAWVSPPRAGAQAVEPFEPGRGCS